MIWWPFVQPVHLQTDAMPDKAMDQTATSGCSRVPPGAGHRRTLPCRQTFHSWPGQS